MSLRDRPLLLAIALTSVVAAAAAMVGLSVVALRDEVTEDLPDPGLPMTSYAPKTVTGTTDIPYGKAPREKLDVWIPKSMDPGETLPTIVWVHGGGWSRGDKSFVAPYLQILADRGFTVVGINYSYAPAAKYPTQVHELNGALAFLSAHALDLHVDADRIVLAGDSAGAQIAAQLAAVTTNPTFAAEVGITPVLEPEQISGLVLASGSFDLVDTVTRVKGSVARYVADYLGTTTDAGLLRLASVTPHVTQDYPPTWVTSGNADALMPQAKDFSQTLKGLGVEVDAVFYDKSHRPLIHEYQFLLGLEESQQALDSAVRFLKERTG